MKILVMKFRNIGDVLLTTPLISNLRRFYPDATIDFALNRGCEAMIEGNKNVRKVHIYEREKIKNAGILGRIRGEFEFALAIRREKYDIALQTTSGDRGIFLGAFSDAKIVVAPRSKDILANIFITHQTPKFSGLRHIIEQNLDALRALGFEPREKRVEIFSDAEICDTNAINALNLPPKFVHFHLTSHWMFKCANDEIMAELIDFCELNLGVRAIITGDKNEAEMKKIAAVLALCNSKPLNLSGKLSLKQVAFLSKKSALFIGVDTAVMHIAAANDVPVIAFFGASGAYEWGPWDNSLMQSGYTRKNGIQTMGRNIVFQKDWDFVPCDKEGIKAHGVEKTLMDFKGKELEAIKSAIKKRLE